MKQLHKSLKEHKNLWLFLAIILAFGMGVGIYFGITSKDLLKNTVTNYSLTEQFTHFSVNHFVVFSVLLITSLLLIGIPLAISYIFYEGMSIGFCFTLFISTFHFKGFLYMLAFTILTKIIFFLLFCYFFLKILNISKSIIAWMIYKKNKKDTIVHLMIGCLLLLLILFCYDLLIDYFGIKLIHALGVLLK